MADISLTFENKYGKLESDKDSITFRLDDGDLHIKALDADSEINFYLSKSELEELSKYIQFSLKELTA